MSFKLQHLVASAIASTCLASFAHNAMADSNKDLVQALVSKGVLTEEEGALLTRGRAEEMDVQKKKEKSFSTSKVNFRGYVQNRSNWMLGGDGDNASNPVDMWMDRSVGTDRSINATDKNFFIRRARLIIFGDVGDRLSYYIQPDFNVNTGGNNGFVQLRDAYGDIYITKNREHRVRVGQSKVPYGFENMQSSSNRLAHDRADSLNSAVRDERDTGAFYYYTPTHVQELFAEIGKQGLKHSGNYGMLALGAYNGQGANRPEQNDNWHVVARATYPWKTETGQIYEVGIQGYSGDFVVTRGAYNRRLSTGVITRQATTNIEGGANGRYRNGFRDERVALSFMMYPQPFGLTGEWNWGRTPGLDIATNTINQESLNGGYLQAMYKIDNFKFFDTNGVLIPFVRWQYFDGYNKAEANAPRNQVNDWEWGAEWQIAPEVEMSLAYHRMNRNNLVTSTAVGAADYQRFTAEALRMQLQYNF